MADLGKIVGGVHLLQQDDAAPSGSYLSSFRSSFNLVPSARAMGIRYPTAAVVDASGNLDTSSNARFRQYLQWCETLRQERGQDILFTSRGMNGMHLPTAWVTHMANAGGGLLFTWNGRPAPHPCYTAAVTSHTHIGNMTPHGHTVGDPNDVLLALLRIHLEQLLDLRASFNASWWRVFHIPYFGADYAEYFNGPETRPPAVPYSQAQHRAAHLAIATMVHQIMPPDVVVGYASTGRGPMVGSWHTNLNASEIDNPFIEEMVDHLVTLYGSGSDRVVFGYNGWTDFGIAGGATDGSEWNKQYAVRGRSTTASGPWLPRKGEIRVLLQDRAEGYAGDWRVWGEWAVGGPDDPATFPPYQSGTYPPRRTLGKAHGPNGDDTFTQNGAYICEVYRFRAAAGQEFADTIEPFAAAFREHIDSLPDAGTPTKSNLVAITANNFATNNAANDRLAEMTQVAPGYDGLALEHFMQNASLQTAQLDQWIKVCRENLPAILWAKAYDWTGSIDSAATADRYIRRCWGAFLCGWRTTAGRVQFMGKLHPAGTKAGSGNPQDQAGHELFMWDYGVPADQQGGKPVNPATIADLFQPIPGVAFYRRDFTRAIVLLNLTNQARSTTINEAVYDAASEMNGDGQLTLLPAGSTVTVPAYDAAFLLKPTGEAPPSALRVNTFEGGTDGAAITPANSGGASGTAFDFVDVGTGGSATFTTEVAQGTLAGRFVRGSQGQAIAGWADNSTQIWIAADMMLPNFVGFTHLLKLTDGTSAAATRLASATLGGTQALHIYDAESFRGSALVGSFPIGQWFRLEFHAAVGENGTGRIEARLWLNRASSGPPDAQIVFNQAHVPQWTHVCFGMGSTTSSTQQVIVDNIRTSTTGWLGPAGPPAPVAPGAPTNVTAAQIGNTNAVSVSFDPPAEQGASPIIEFEARSDPGDHTGIGPESPVTVEGLDFGETYRFTVRARNSDAEGSPSEPSNPVTPTGVPGPPTGVSAVAGNGQATVSFTPGAPNGSPVTNNIVTSTPGGITASGPSSPITVTGLTNGASYTFRVRSVNARGEGPQSEPSNAVTPSAPTSTVPPGGYGVGTLDVLVPSGGRDVRVRITYPTQGGQPVKSRTFALIAVGHGQGQSGDGSMGSFNSSQQHAFLVQAGYIVVAPSFHPPGDTAINLTRMTREARDAITYALELSAAPTGVLSGMVDPTRIGWSGTSMGGIIGYALGFSNNHRDARIKALSVKAAMAMTVSGGYGWNRPDGPHVLHVHGSADTIVAYSSGRSAWNNVNGPQKGWIRLAGVGHDLSGAGTTITNGTRGFFNHFLYDGTPSQGLNLIQQAVNQTAAADLYERTW